MDFPTSLKLLHLLAIVVAGCGLLVFMREAGLRAFGAAYQDESLRWPSLSMMAGVFLMCMTVGGLLTFTVFQTSGVTELSLLVTRAVAIGCLSLSCIGLHLYVRPLFASDAVFNTMPIGQAIFASLIAGLACMSMLLWIATGVAASEIMSIALPQLLQLTGLFTLVLTISFTGLLVAAHVHNRGASARAATQDQAPTRKLPPAFEPVVFAPRRPAPRPHFEPTFNSRYSEAPLHAAQ